MRGKGLALVALAAAALVAAGCGGNDEAGGGGEPLTKQEWIAQADAICVDAQQQVEALGDPGSDLAKLAELTAEAEQIFGAQIAALRDLAAPEGDEEQVDAMLKQVEKRAEGFAALIEAATAGDIAKLQEITADDSEFSQARIRADELAKAYGLEECGAGS